MTAKSFLLVMLVGCGVDNSQAEVGASIYDRGTASAIGVTVQNKGETKPLSPLDGLSATLHVRGQTIPLSAYHDVLSADLALSPPIATDEQLELDVSRDGASAHLTVTAPPPLDLTAPFPLFVPRSQDLTVAWTTASDDPMTWYVDGDECIDGPSGNLDPGATQVVIPAAKFGMEMAYDTTCTSGFHLHRGRAVTAEATGFDTATFAYVRSLDIPFASTP